MASRAWKLVAILLALATFAAACSGESDDEVSSGDDAGDDGGDDGGGDDGSSDDGGDDGSGDDDGTSDDGGDDGSGDDDDGTSDDGGDDGSANGDFVDDPVVYEDPRGGIFLDYQNSIDRSHPFQPIDTFCRPNAAAASLEDPDHPGIDAESVTIVHLRSRLEQLADIGFAVDIGDPVDQFETFVEFVNTECGGVRGRQVDLRLVEVDSFNPGADIDALRNTACIEATEDNNALIVINSSGFQGSANLCIVEQHEAIFISTQGQPDEFMDRGAGRLVSVSTSIEDGVRYMLEAGEANGAFDGRTIAVIGPDTPGQVEPTEFIVDELEANGHNVAVFEIIGCNGTTSCADGVPAAVAAMVDAGVDMVLPTLNVVSLPGFIGEMVTAGYEPGSVQFYQSNFNSQSGDLVASKVVAFGGEEAGLLYNGTIAVDAADTGNFREPDFEPHAFNEMCNDVYSANSERDRADVFDTANSEYGAVTSVCVMLRMALRAIYDAGDNPSFDDVVSALNNLGPVDSNGGYPASLNPDKLSIEDAIHEMRWEFPCSHEIPGFGAEDTCWYNESPYILVN